MSQYAYYPPPPPPFLFSLPSQVSESLQTCLFLFPKCFVSFVLRVRFSRILRAHSGNPMAKDRLATASDPRTRGADPRTRGVAAQQ